MIYFLPKHNIYSILGMKTSRSKQVVTARYIYFYFACFKFFILFKKTYFKQIQEIEPRCGELLCRSFDLNEINNSTQQPLSVSEINNNLHSIVGKSKQRHAELAHEIENSSRRHRKSENERANSRSRSLSRDRRSPTRDTGKDIKEGQSPNGDRTSESNGNPELNTDPISVTNPRSQTHRSSKDYVSSRTSSHYSSSSQHPNQQQSFRLAYRQIIFV